MSKSLIIVESPAKIKTLKKFLNNNYIFESSIGHVRDLPEKEFGIDIEADFEPKYVIMPNKEEVIERLQKAAKKCDVIYLAPDPDREGEAIAWHIMQLLPKNANVKRISFNAITKDAVIKALEQPRSIDLALVHAQQARRLLDRIVGYKISPLLNRRIQRGKEIYLSAGRVQSVALKLAVNREKEIQIFMPVEYWNLGAILKTPDDERSFRAALYSIDGKRFEKEPIPGKEVCLIPNKATADAIIDHMQHGPFIVLKVERKEKKRNPVPPFITSTLQQEASRHYGFSSSRTMSIAQSLYEGIELGSEGAEGLITYMRTDSVRVVPEALIEVRKFIEELYGMEYVPAEAKKYSTQKAAQDAHEAIRPANIKYTPESIQHYLSREQFQLYQLIWRRFIASQMMPAVYDTISADISANKGILLRAVGSVIKFPGFLAVYEERNDDEEKDDENRLLPKLIEGQYLKLDNLTVEQSFTRAPPRYTEASLVKELEKSGIGRPSTYAAIMNKIQSREYTIKENGRLKPTELGQIISQMLENSFNDIMNIGFTAAMEDDLERVAENTKDWKVLIREFWEKFNPTFEIALKEAFVPKIITEIDCPKCKDGKLQKIWARSKYFYGCSNYPECDYSKPIEEVAFNKNDYAIDFNWEQACPLCSSEMKVRHGRYGTFLGCLRYPECKGIINIPKKGEEVLSQENLPVCPAIGCPGKMVARKSRFGKTFYSCSTFPECNVIIDQIDRLSSKYENHPRTVFVKNTSKKTTIKKTTIKKTTNKKTGINIKKTITKKSKVDSEVKSANETTPKTPRIMPLYRLSTELEALMQARELSRGEVTKRIWDYIKKHQLQDEKDKKMINPDNVLAAIFGSHEPVNMLKIATLLTPHLHKVDKKK